MSDKPRPERGLLETMHDTMRKQHDMIVWLTQRVEALERATGTDVETKMREVTDE